MVDKKNTDIIVRCPKCSIVYSDINKTKFKTSNLPILLYSDNKIVFKCISCNVHIPLMITHSYNVYSPNNEGYIIGKSKFNLF